MTIYQGDALKVLRKLKPASVQTCVTSPPYWGLRDYGTAQWEGGAKGCDHRKVSPGTASIGKSTLGPNRDGVSGQASNGHQQEGFKSVCRKCGARRIDQQIGLESTPEAYVARMVEVFREVRRVLKDDGTLWLNLGDSYATGAGKVGNCPGGGAQGERWAGRGMNTKQPKWAKALGPIAQPNRMPIAGLKPKDLIGIPWRVAFALQADGWYLRSDIIWAKPNPMPESVRDRPTKAHEYLFLLAKSPRYFYDAAAIKLDGSLQRSGNTQHKYVNGQQLHRTKSGFSAMRQNVYPKVNRRTVWTVTPQPFKGAHFATFPPKLIEPCILAGAPKGGVVLDPFAGAGTTLITAERLGRKGVGIELNPAYVALAQERENGLKSLTRAA